MSEQTAKVVQDEELSSAQKEEKVLESSGVNTKESEETYKVDLSKPSKKEDDTYKVDLREKPKTEEDAIQEQSTDESVLRSSEQSEESGQDTQVEVQRVEEENKEEAEVVLERIEDTEDTEEPEQKLAEPEKQEIIQEAKENNIELPENIQKVVEFMQETGGSLEDYVRLNADYSNVDDSALLYEYYKQTKSHLDKSEIDFLIDDSFSFDEEIDEERDIKRKKLAYKEEIAKAKNFLEDLKGKYYEEVKLSSKLNPDQQKAIDFFNRYSKEQSETEAVQQKQHEHFKNVTNSVFNEEFKGFDFKVGDSKFRYKVNDVQKVKEVQSDLTNVVSKFLDNNNMLSDAKGYHKALFAAQNADALANHFYQQGKADAITQLQSESKNINMDPRKSEVIEAGGIKVRAISGEDSSKLKIKLRK